MHSTCLERSISMAPEAGGSLTEGFLLVQQIFQTMYFTMSCLTDFITVMDKIMLIGVVIIVCKSVNVNLVSGNGISGRYV